MNFSLLANAFLSFISLIHADKHETLPQYKAQVAVLMYHHVHDADKSLTTIPTSLFREHISFLQQKGYHFISLQQFKQFLHGAPVPEKAVMVTFDDGYRSFYDNAYPILQQFQVPAVNFIITSSLDRPDEDMPTKLSRDQIAEITAATKPLTSFQCHTHALHAWRDDHTALLLKTDRETDDAYKQRIKHDTEACIHNLTPLSRETIDSFAYPFGVYNKQAIEALQPSGIKYAFTTEAQMTIRQVDRMQIPRINAGNPNITPGKLNGMILRRVVKP